MNEPTNAESMRELFAEARGLTGEQLERWIVGRGLSETTRAELVSLLNHDVDDSFLEQPVVPNGIGNLARSGAETRSFVAESNSSSPLGLDDRYKLLQRIGEGGFGVVYMADQLKPVRRRVAIKLLKPGMDTKNIVARFESERQALAMMEHPAIAKVFDGGVTSEGRPYFVMELVGGVPVTEYCQTHNLSLIQRIELLVRICDAIQHAHQKGVIHRDIKPSNILVQTTDGVPQPKVIDFGIAKAITGPLTDKTLFTEFRQLIGTPEYMSPEQAYSSTEGADTRSDVYSLGVLLYELLTGTTPFDGKELRRLSIAEMQRTIREVEPPRPSTRLNSSSLSSKDTAQSKQLFGWLSSPRNSDGRALSIGVDTDLDWIVMKAIDKDRERRYSSARDLGDELKRWIGGDPIIARPPSLWYRARKTISKHKRLAFMIWLATTAILVAAAGIGFGFASQRAAFQNAQAERDIAEQARMDAEKQLARANQLSYGNTMVVAIESFQSGRREITRSLLAACDQGSRGPEWSWLSHMAADRSMVLRGHNGAVHSVVFSPDSRRVASAGSDGMVRLWNVDSGLEHKSWRVSQKSATKLAFSPDGAKLLVGDELGSLGLWNIETADCIHRMEMNSEITALMLSADSNRVAVGCMDGQVAVVRLPEWGLEHRFVPSTNRFVGEIQSVLFRPDSDELVAAGRGGLRYWNLTSGELLGEAGQYWQSYGAIQPQDRDSLVVFGPPVALVDYKSRSVTREWSMPATGIWSAATIPDSDQIVLATQDQCLRLLDLRTNTQETLCYGDQGVIRAIACSDNSDCLAIAGDDGTVRLWHRAQFATMIAEGTQRIGIEQLAFVGSHRVAAVGSDRQLGIWSLKDGRRLSSDSSHAKECFALEAIADGSLIVSSSFDQTLRIWKTDNAEAVETIPMEWGTRGIAIEPRGQFFAGPLAQDRSRYTAINRTDRDLSQEGNLAIWDIGTRTITQVLPGLRNWSVALSFSPTGTMLAAASVDDGIVVWDRETGNVLKRFQAANGIMPSQVVFSHDSRFLYSGHRDGQVNVWDLRSGERVSHFVCHGDEISSLALTRQGNRLLTASKGDSRIRLWNTISLQRVAEFETHFAGVSSMKLASEETVMVAGGVDYGLRIFKLSDSP